MIEVVQSETAESVSDLLVVEVFTEKNVYDFIVPDDALESGRNADKYDEEGRSADWDELYESENI